jgi:hypothetical protein
MRSEMSAQKSSKARTWLPVIIPLAINFIGSVWVIIAARSARSAEECGINLPWDEASSYLILERLFPSALNEAENFKRVVSSCVASLHADVASAYIIILMVAVISGFFVLKFTSFPSIPWHTDDHDKYIKSVGAAIILLFICLAGYYIATVVHEAIDFTGKVRRMIHVKDGYVSLGAYWLVTQLTSFVLIMALWLFYYVISALNGLFKTI